MVLRLWDAVRPKLLDRYLLKNFLFAYLMVVMVIVTLFIVVDIPVRIKKFKKAACGRSVAVGAKVCHSCGTRVPEGSRRCPKAGMSELAISHYSSQIPILYYQMSPFLTALAGILVIFQLQRRNELIPMQSAGLSPYRIVLPLAIAALLLGALVWSVQEMLIPRLNKIVQKAGLIGMNRDQKPDPIPDNQGGVLFVGVYDTLEQRMDDVLYQQLDEQYRELLEVKAEYGLWSKSLGRWVLYNGVMRSPGAAGKVSMASFSVDKPYVLETQIFPRDIVEAAMSVDSLSSQELQEQQQRLPHDHQRMAVILESRLAYPFAGFILLLLGLPFFLDTNSHWMQHIGCLFLLATYYIATFVLLDFAKVNVVSPRFAAWAPNACYLVLGLLLMARKVG